MKNNIGSLSIRELLSLGASATTGAQAIGREVGLVLNKADRIDTDCAAAAEAVLGYQKEVANRVPKAAAFQAALATARTWCTRAKDTLKPHLGDRHSSLWRPTGFTTSLRVPRDYTLYALVDALAKYLAEHPEQANSMEKVNVTEARALEVLAALKSAKDDLDAQDALVQEKHAAQNEAFETLRSRLRGLKGELEQLIGAEDPRWRRLGFNIPAEPETPAQPGGVTVNSNTPGQLLVSCEPVAFAERYRWFVQQVGTTAEPEATGTSVEPLFVIDGLEPGAQFNVYVSAVNAAGGEGLCSEAAVGHVLARAAA